MPGVFKKLQPVSHRLRFVAFFGFIFSSLLWCFTVLTDFSAVYGKYQFYAEPNSLFLAYYEGSNEKPYVRFRTDHFASNYRGNWFPIEFLETDNSASITVYISPFIIGFGLIAAIGKRKAAIKLLKGGRIRRRGIGRWIVTFKLAAIFAAIAVIGAWRVSYSYSIWFQSFEIAPRAFLGLGSDCGGLCASIIRLKISEVGWKQYLEVEKGWQSTSETEPLFEKQPIEIGMHTIHPRAPLLPSLDVFNTFRPHCLLGKCPHGNACEVKTATKWDTTLWMPYWLMFLISGFVAFRLIWRDRPWSSGKCRRCGFNIISNTTGCCPECGLTFIGQWTKENADMAALLSSSDVQSM